MEPLTVEELINKVKEKLKVDSDYALAKALDLSQKDISNWRKGITFPAVYACFRFAEVLETSPTIIIAMMYALRTGNGDRKRFFKQFYSIVGLWIILGQQLPEISTSIERGYEVGTSVRTASYNVIAHYAK